MNSLSARHVLGVSGFVGFLFSVAAWGAAPPCMSGGRELGLDNNQALSLKKTAPLGQTLRAHVAGQVTRVFSDHSNHAHFEIMIGNAATDTLEVVYSEDFGALPDPSIGAQVETCGDFINSNAPFKSYPASPSGAIIHWVHRSDSASHDSGYVMLDNVVYGNGADKHPRKFY
jgi:hypothetical protein